MLPNLFYLVLQSLDVILESYKYVKAIYLWSFVSLEVPFQVNEPVFLFVYIILNIAFGHYLSMFHQSAPLIELWR